MFSFFSGVVTFDPGAACTLTPTWKCDWGTAALAVLQVLLLPLLLLLLLLLLAALVVVSVDAVVERVQAAVPVAAPVGALVAVMVVVQRGRLAVLAVEVAGRAAAQVSEKFQKLHVEMPW